MRTDVSILSAGALVAGAILTINYQGNGQAVLVEAPPMERALEGKEADDIKAALPEHCTGTVRFFMGNVGMPDGSVAQRLQYTDDQGCGGPVWDDTMEEALKKAGAVDKVVEAPK